MTVILADDEPMIIRGLRKLIPWQELGIQIVGEASSGSGLLELIDSLQPDLIVTDISMPDGTGIDVIKEIQKRGLRTRVIFISAYQEFSYAKDALAFGAVDYLVKPIEKGLLLDALRKALTLLQVESEGQTSKGKLAVYEHKDKKTQLEELFDRLTEGDILTDEAHRKMAALEHPFGDGCYSVMALEIDPKQEEEGRWGEHEKRLLLFAISNIAGELAELFGAGIVIRKKEHLCIVINHAAERPVLALAEETLEKIRFYLKINATVGVGQTVCELQHLRQAYATAASALRQSYFAGSGKVISCYPVRKEAADNERQQQELRQSLLQALLAQDRGAFFALLSQLFDQIEIATQGSKEAAVTGCYSLLLELIEELEGVGVQAGIILQEDQDWLLAMHGFHRFDQLKAAVAAKFAGIFDIMKSTGGKEVQQMKIVKEYIEHHYMENITLDSIASMVFMNPYYFSSFFKKHTNENFKQYVTGVRMKQAVKLLLQTDLMVYEIAERVGYNNTRQFSDMFKKHFGKLPQEYKNMKG